MNTLHLVTGGSASGKSGYAEQLLAQTGEEHLFYLATMKPWDEECKARIRRHQRIRAGKGFLTLESCSHLEQITLDTPPEHTALLLECMSNLTANERFESRESDEELEERILEGVKSLQKQLSHFIIVTNEVFSDGGFYGEETLRYQRLLGNINRRIAAYADAVTEVVYGIEIPVKRTCGR